MTRRYIIWRTMFGRWSTYEIRAMKLDELELMNRCIPLMFVGMVAKGLGFVCLLVLVALAVAS